MGRRNYGSVVAGEAARPGMGDVDAVIRRFYWSLLRMADNYLIKIITVMIKGLI